MKAGLVFANGGSDGTKTSYLRPWTSPKKAIMGGASYIGEGYIASTQNTMYLSYTYIKFKIFANVWIFYLRYK